MSVLSQIHILQKLEWLSQSSMIEKCLYNSVSGILIIKTCIILILVEQTKQCILLQQLAIQQNWYLLNIDLWMSDNIR